MIEPLPPGRAGVIGPYQPLGLLGAGGMGEVYLARPAGAADPLAGLVALKTVRPDLDLDDGFRIRFRREIEAAGAVRSPHTAALVGGDASGRLPWLATEYVPGPSLAEAVTRGGSMPEHVVREMGAGLARGLVDMHAVRVLHRDLKPGNVLLGTDGPKIIDFGIAQAFDATQLTRTGVVVGSPGYISPEHVNGSRSLVPASDVFCLGAVLAFAAAGRGPFDDSDMAAVIFRISRGEAELSGVPPRLREVIEACLRTGAGDRPTPLQLVDMLLPAGRVPEAAPGAFPWTDAVRGLLAAHAADARAVAEAVAPQAAVPQTFPYAPNVLNAPTQVPGRGAPPFAPTPVAPVAAPGDGRRKRALRIGFAAAAVVVCVVLGAVLLPGLVQGDEGSDDAGAAEGTGQPTASVSGAARKKAGTAVVPGADAGRTGNFGAVAADASNRPTGWKPWTAKIADGPVACVLADTFLVCDGPRRITALDAATGEQRWQTPEGRPGTGRASVAAVADGSVYAFQDGALVALGLADGAEKRRDPLPDGMRMAGFVEAGGVLHYVTVPTAGGGATGHVTARKLGERYTRLWDRQWDAPAQDTQLLFADGRLVVVGNGITVLSGADGTRLGGVAADELTCRTPVLKGDELLCVNADGLVVADVTALRNRRTVAAGVDIAYRPAVSRDGKVVLSSGTRVFAFGLSDGGQYWATSARFADMTRGGAPVVVGDRALLVDGYGVGAYALDTTGEEDMTGSKMYTDWPSNPGDPLDPASVSLVASGDVLFLGFGDGTVLSGYAP